MRLIDRKSCRSCNGQWHTEDVLEHFMKEREKEDSHYYKMPEQGIRKIAESYGWTEHTPVCFSDVILVKANGKRDRIRCPHCKKEWDAISEEMIK